MRILGALPGPSDRNARVVLVDVAAGEVADIEAMAELVIGKASGHLGIQVALVAVGGPLPQDLLERALQGNADLPRQFGFPGLSQERGLERTFKLTIDLR